MRLLLDSHTLIWWMDRHEMLSRPAFAAISDAKNQIFISSASIWELNIKAAKKKLRFPSLVNALLDHEGFTELPITIHHAETTRTLPMIHSDPFDRMLIAQAMEEELILVTRDKIIGQYSVPVLLA